MRNSKSDLTEKFEALLDVGYQERGIEVIRVWADCPESAYETGWAKIVTELLIDPLYWWIGTQKGNRLEVRAAEDLAEYARLDIAYGLQCRQKLYPEHISKLDALWKEFQRQIGCGALYDADLRRTRTSRRQSMRASAPRKKQVTKEALEKFSEKYSYNHGTKRGWKMAACLEFGIDFKTLKKRI
jgi:hypothetical protein